MKDAQGDSLRTAARRIGIASPGVLLGGLLGSGAVPLVSVWALPLVVAGSLVICILLCVARVPPPRARSSVALAAILAVVCWLVPATVAILLRLLVHQCPVLNPLGLPWPDDVRLAVRVLGSVIIVAAAVGLMWSWNRRELAGAARVMRTYLLITAFPALLLFFLLIFGDPGPDCVPG